jgi:glutathione S-transferase
MCEEHLYLALIATRWCDDENFAKGPAFKGVPMPIRPIVQSMVRRKVKKNLTLQGFGRHTRAEQDPLAIVADIEALATLLNEKTFLMGEKPCGADAAVFSFVAFFLTPALTTKVRAAAEKHQNLVGYRHRILSRYFEI